MPYIEGVGYVNDATYIGETIGGVTLSTVKPQGVESEFNKVYSEEIAKIEGDGSSGEKTYVLEDIFKKASETYGISEQLLKAIAYTESGFDATAVSSAGAKGMMQLAPVTVEMLGIEDPFDPYENIMGGARVLAEFKNMFNGDESLMVAAYNAGPGAVQRYGGIPPYTETLRHHEKVFSAMQNGVNPPATVTYNPETKQASSGAYTDYQAMTNALQTQVVSSVLSGTADSSDTVNDSLMDVAGSTAEAGASPAGSTAFNRL